jgi:hypothetical protein
MLLMLWKPRTDRLNMVAARRRNFSVVDALCLTVILHEANQSVRERACRLSGDDQKERPAPQFLFTINLSISKLFSHDPPAAAAVLNAG